MIKFVRELLFHSVGLFLGCSLLWAAPTRLTQSTGQDTNPAWEPGGNRIVYMRSIPGSGVPFDLYVTRPDGSVTDQPFLLGPATGFGVGASPTWFGTTGVLATEERVFFHEYLLFDASQAPFTRTIDDGNDLACTTLLSIDGGGGGGFIRISRDNSTALVRFSTDGGGGTVSVRTGTVANLNGSSVTSFGTLIFSEDTGSDQKYLAGVALSPNGQTFVLAKPIGAATTAHDLWLYSSDGSGSPVNLTNTASSGLYNISPDYSPDGTRIAFARWSGVQGEAYDLYMMNSDGSNVVQLTDTPFFSESGPSWGPDGTQIAFGGAHLSGKEQEEPALPKGETANANIYIMNISDLPGSGTVTPGTILDAPTVSVSGNSATVTAQKFSKASFKKSGKARLTSITTNQAKGAKTSFRYQFSLDRLSDENGGPSGKDPKPKTSKRNEYTFKNLPPGNYSASYKVEIMQKQDGQSKTKRTKPSAGTLFNIS